MPRNTETTAQRRRMGLDPRIKAVFSGAPPWAQVMAGILAAQAGPEVMQSALDEFAPRGVDWDEQVAGRPLRFYNGLNKRQLRDMGVPDSDIAKVSEAYEARDMEFPEGDEPPPEIPAPPRPLAIAETDPNRQPISPSTDPRFAPGVPATVAAGSSAEGPEPEFGHGDQRRPLSQLAGMSDDELLAIDGIGPNSIQRIRREAAARGLNTADAGRPNTAAGTGRPTTPSQPPRESVPTPTPSAGPVPQGHPANPASDPGPETAPTPAQTASNRQREQEQQRRGPGRPRSE